MLSLKKRVRNVVVGLDQTANGMCNGSRDTTISGRCYYNATRGVKSDRAYWLRFMRVIDFCFYGYDGRHHCKQAYRNDPSEKYQPANRLDKVLLVLISVVPCVVVGTTGYAYLALKHLGRAIKNANIRIN